MGKAPVTLLKRLRFSPDLRIATVLFVLASSVGMVYVSTWGRTPHFFQELFGPAVLFACGRGFENPVDEAAPVSSLAASQGLASVLLIAPTTPPARRLEIASHSAGFIYYMSVAGITGERTALPAATLQAVAELETHTDTPICVGFGISNPETVKVVCAAAAGAIVGSAIVHRITDNKDLPPDQLAARIGEFVGELLEPIA